MAGYFCCGEGGNASPGSARRWTEGLPNVLHSSTARQKFHEFLKSKNLKKGQSLLEFWEKCDKFLTQAEKSEPYRKGQSSQGTTRSPTMKQEACLITEFADRNINFDAGQMRALRMAVESEDKDTMMEAISQAKQSAAKMLEGNGYEQFCTYQRTEQGL